MTTPSLPLVVGAWIDDPIAQIDAKYAARFAKCFKHGAIMANEMNARSSAPGFRLRADTATFTRAAKALQGAGVEVSLTCWPRPDKAQLAELEAGMAPLLDACGATAIEVDTEANWDSKLLKGFKTMDEAATELVAVLRRLAAGHRRVELTTYPYHTENSAKARVAPHVDLLLPQAYSVNERSGTAVAWGDKTLGPGGMQRMSLDRARETGAAPGKLGCGLAAYEQRFAGHKPEEAMQVAVDAVRKEGVRTIRYWSSKWIVGVLASKQPWAEKFVQTLGGGVAG